MATPAVPTPVASPPEPDPFFPTEPAAASGPDEVEPEQPVTGEMVALDAFDAFGAVWDAGEHPHAASSPVPPASPQPTDSLADPASLGSGLDTYDAWAEDITTGEVPRSDTPPPAAAPATPSLGMPAWLEDDHEPAPTAFDLPAHETTEASIHNVVELPSVSGWEQPVGAADDRVDDPMDVEAGSAPAAFTAASGSVTPDMIRAAEEPPRFEPEEERRPEDPGMPSAPASIDRHTVHGLRVSATLDRLAQRVRGGEIDVSSVAPEATDAAVLASVLAALLGGSRGR